MEKSELKAIFDNHYNNDLESFIQKLKDFGASQMECTRTLVYELKLPLSKADKIVVNSKAWKENNEMVNKLRDDFYDTGSSIIND